MVRNIVHEICTKLEDMAGAGWPDADPPQKIFKKEENLGQKSEQLLQMLKSLA